MTPTRITVNKIGRNVLGRSTLDNKNISAMPKANIPPLDKVRIRAENITIIEPAISNLILLDFTVRK